jgi:hypothetical protein
MAEMIGSELRFKPIDGMSKRCEHCRRRADADRGAVAAEAIAQPAYEHRDIGALPAAIGVKFVKNYEVEPLAARRTRVPMFVCADN